MDVLDGVSDKRQRLNETEEAPGKSDDQYRRTKTAKKSKNFRMKRQVVSLIYFLTCLCT